MDRSAQYVCEIVALLEQTLTSQRRSKVAAIGAAAQSHDADYIQASAMNLFHVKTGAWIIAIYCNTLCTNLIATCQYVFAATRTAHLLGLT